jgi:hypothetical protein
MLDLNVQFRARPILLICMGSIFGRVNDHTFYTSNAFLAAPMMMVMLSFATRA